MKATINGIEVEGTPEEVWAFLQKQNAQGTNLKPYQPMPNFDKYWKDYYDAQKKQQWVDCGSTGTPGYMKWPNVICMNL